MELLYLLERWRTPVLDQVFSVLTYLGSEVVFLVLAVVLYWCVSKSRGLYLMTVGCLGTMANQFLKLICRVPRPWVRDPNFTIVESARADAGGYSFPSGHTQNAVGTFGCLAMEAKKTWQRILLIGLAVVTAFSRMYLGVHTPWDVVVAAAMAVLLIVVLHPLFGTLEQAPRRGLWILGGLTAVSACFVAYVSLWQFPADVDAGNLASGVGNIWKLLGALLGMTAGYAIDLKWVHYETKAPLVGQICKVVLGIALMLVLKEGLKPVLGVGAAAGAVRYGLVTLFASGIWPMTFRFFANVGKRV